MSLSTSTVCVGMNVAATNAAMQMSIGAKYEVVGGERYSGQYEFTPTQETQTVYTNGLICSDNITINPIPSNYGLITYNGSYITVS